MDTKGRGGKRSGAGRPKGSKNRATVEMGASLTELASSYTEAALLTLAEIMQDKEATATARVAAANSLLDRAHGKPAQAEPPDSGANNIADALRDIAEQLPA